MTTTKFTFKKFKEYAIPITASVAGASIAYCFYSPQTSTAIKNVFEFTTYLKAVKDSAIKGVEIGLPVGTVWTLGWKAAGWLGFDDGFDRFNERISKRIENSKLGRYLRQFDSKNN